MFQKCTKILFIVISAAALLVPLCFTDFKGAAVSDAEKRMLAPFPSLHSQEGGWNQNYSSDFEAWLDDNIGLRSKFVVANAKIMFYGFRVLANNSDMYLGPGGELDYITEDILKDYQHLDLRSDAEMKEITDSYQYVSDYLKERGIQYYYFQCWDKQSVYPEQFPLSIRQYAEISKTDQLIAALENDTDIFVVSPKQELIQAKKEYETYSTWGDPTHWTQRGARIGYRKLLAEINKHNSQKYKILQDEDYEIALIDQGMTVFGGIYKECLLEAFLIKDPTAYHSDEAPIYGTHNPKSGQILINDTVDNRDTLLIIGDSYIEEFLYEDFGESFHKVVMAAGDNMVHLEELIERYQPQIVIEENAERCDRTKRMAETAALLRK